jgi:PAS domain S-box-containing protein
MASQLKVRQYLAYWLQLGKKVFVCNGEIAERPQPTIEGDRYSSDFESLWQAVGTPEFGDCYLEGTDETISDLLSPEWDIVECSRCTMPIPLRSRGMPPHACPCNDLPTWPNSQIPAPRSPVNDRRELGSIRDRLHQMADRADLYALSILQDLNDYKQAEQAVERLRLQNELILNSAGEGICGLDADLKITYLNPAAAIVLQTHTSHAIGMPIASLFAAPDHPSGDSCQPEAPIATTIAEGSVQYVTNAWFLRPNGKPFPVEYVSAPIRQNGQIVGAVVTFKDITERQEIERMKDELLSMVSHELRTPVAAIRGALGLLASGVISAEAQKGRRMLEIALNNTDRLLLLLNDILDIEGMTSGKIVMHPDHCDASEIAAQAVESIQPLAEKGQISLFVRVPKAPIYCDRDRAIQVLTNLLSNAIKFSPPESSVWLDAEIGDRDILFQVRDRGRGIPKEKLETIFERFQQVDSSDSRAYGGSGLGLAICRQIVLQHGGRIWVESELSRGSQFFFTLPLG